MKSRGNESLPEEQGGRTTIHQLFQDGREIDLALKSAIRKALLRHKKLGNSIVVWRDGEVVEIPPEEIPT